MQSQLTGTLAKAPRQLRTNNDRHVFRVTVIATWALLLSYLLLSHTSTNQSVWQRYSPQYDAGLLVYLSLVLLWPLLLILPERQIDRISANLDYIKSYHWLHAQYIFSWIFLTLLVLMLAHLWGWSYDPVLWLDLLLLGIWLTFLPTFWGWGIRGWSLKWLSPNWLYDWLSHNRQLWLPPLIGAVVLLSSNVLGFNASPRHLMLMLALLPGIGVVLIFRHWPAIGLMALIITGLFVPSPNLPGGLNLAVLLLILLIGLWLLEMLFEWSKAFKVKSRTVWPLMAFILVSIFSFGVGQLPWFTFVQSAPLDAQLGGLAILILAPGIFLLVAHQVRDLRWLQLLTWSFIALTSIHIVAWLLPPIRPFTIGLFQDGTINNAMFWLWLVALAFSQALYNQKLHLGWRLLLGGVVVATLYVGLVLNNDWKSGYLPPLVCVGVLIGLRSWRTGLVLALIGYPLAMYLSSKAIATDDYSYSTRIDAILVMLELIKFNPITGFGPANYFWYTPLFPIRGYAINFNSHNQYIDIVAQTGLLGLACFFWFAGELAWLGWRLRTQVPAGFARAYVYGALGGLAGMLAAGVLVDWFLPFTYNIGLTGFRMSMLAWLFLGGLVSLEQIYRRGAQANQDIDAQACNPTCPGQAGPRYGYDLS